MLKQVFERTSYNPQAYVAHSLHIILFGILCRYCALENLCKDLLCMCLGVFTALGCLWNIPRDYNHVVLD